MKTDPKIIDLLNEVLTGELTAINQYFLHGRMCKNWGYARLGEKIHKESIDEMRHADWLVERILFLEGLPNLQRLGMLSIGQTAVEVLKNDHALEMVAVPDAQPRHQALPRPRRQRVRGLAHQDPGLRGIPRRLARTAAGAGSAVGRAALLGAAN